MTLHEIAANLMALPPALLFLIGHALPLTLAMYCAWSLRRYARTTYTLPFAAAMFSNGWLLYLTAEVVRTPMDDGGVMVSVAMLPAVSVLLAVAVSANAVGRLDWRAVFAGTFFPMYLVDVFCSHTLFGPSWGAVLSAVGGAGPVDALVLIPALTVAANWLVGHNRLTFEKYLRLGATV